eukprot:5338462-Amphidinium_carterae.1
MDSLCPLLPLPVGTRSPSFIFVLVKDIFGIGRNWLSATLTRLAGQVAIAGGVGALLLALQLERM